MALVDRAVAEWGSWLDSFQLTAGGFLEARCGVCAASDLVALVPELDPLPHGVIHPLVADLERELRAARDRYVTLRMGAHHLELQRRLDRAVPGAQWDIFEVELRSVLRDEFRHRERVEFRKADAWAETLRQTAVSRLQELLGDRELAFAALLDRQYRGVIARIPDILVPGQVLGDAAVRDYFEPLLSSIFADWVKWLVHEEWRDRAVIPLGDSCPECDSDSGLSFESREHVAWHRLWEQVAPLRDLARETFPFARAEPPVTERAILDDRMVMRVLMAMMVEQRVYAERAISLYVSAAATRPASGR